VNLATTTQNMDTCIVANANVLRVISKLLKVKNQIIFEIIFYWNIIFKIDENGLSEGLLKRTIFAHGEAVVTPLNQEQAVDIRYESLFSRMRE
jgi:hypothetical protein